MKRFLSTVTALLLFAELSSTFLNKTLWPLSPYNMFAFRIYDPAHFTLFEAGREGERRYFYAWNLMPMDMYRSYRLLDSGANVRPLIERAVLRYHRETPKHPVFRSAFPDEPPDALAGLRVVQVDLSRLLPPAVAPGP